MRQSVEEIKPCVRETNIAYGHVCSVLVYGRHSVYIQTDGRTDGQTTCLGNIAR